MDTDSQDSWGSIIRVLTFLQGAIVFTEENYVTKSCSLLECISVRNGFI
jgi:hypothetical protein